MLGGEDLGFGDKEFGYGFRVWGLGARRVFVFVGVPLGFRSLNFGCLFRVQVVVWFVGVLGFVDLWTFRILWLYSSGFWVCGFADLAG